MITKNQIKLIKSLRLKKNRIQSGFFVAEGEKIVDELLKSDLEAVNIFSISEKYKNLKNYISINSSQLKQISNLKSPTEATVLYCVLPKSYTFITLAFVSNHRSPSPSAEPSG